MLTSLGREERATIIREILKRKLSEYEEIKHQIKEIAKEAEKDEAINSLGADKLGQLARII